MANRLFNQFSFGLEKMRVSLFLSFTVDGLGAPILDASNSKGIASIEKLAGTGEYRIHLQDAYIRMLMLQQVSMSPTTGVFMTVLSDDVQNKAIDVLFFDVAGMSVDLAPGVEKRMSIVLRNSTAP